MDSKDEVSAEASRRDMAAENSDAVALTKKRARRVSFAAEMTSVHIFDRDEEFNETPSVAAANMTDDPPAEFGFGGLSERGKEFGGEDDGEYNLEDEVMEMQRSFLRPIGSPSSGGSTLGSASSNDEDNFFGPVSANFIRPGRLSDSASSDENHDLTMDSTAFSMHFRSLARSESGDLKTPTGGQLFFEEKTPTDSNKGSSMVYTLGKKPVPKSPVPITEISANHGSNDMSLVGESPNKYDYAKLSPELDALLAKTRKNLLYVSGSDGIASVSPKRTLGQVLTSVDHVNCLANLSDSIRKGRSKINFEDQSGDANGSHRNFLGGCSPKSSTLDVAASNNESHEPDGSPCQLNKDEVDDSLAASTCSPVKQQQTLLASPSKSWGVRSPLPEKFGSLPRYGSIELLETEASIELLETEASIQKSISKLDSLEKAASAFRAKVDSSTIKSLDFIKSPNIFENNHDLSRINSSEDSVNEGKIISVRRSTERNFAFGINHAGGENLYEKPLNHTMNGKLFNAKSISGGKSNSEPAAASPSKNTWSGNNLIRSLFTSNNHEDLVMTETESLLAEICFGESGKAITPKFVPSPDRVLDSNLPASPGLVSNQSTNSQSHFNQMADFDKGRYYTPGRDPAHVNSLNAAYSLDVVSEGMNGDLRSPSVEINRHNHVELRAADNRETDMPNGKEIIQTTDNFIMSATENQFQDVHLDAGDLTNKEVSSSEDYIPGAESRMVPDESVSPSAYRNLNQPLSQKFPAGSSFRKEPDDKQLSRIPSPRTTQMNGGLENYSANKRNVELLLIDPQHRTEISIVERSPKLQKSGNSDPEKIVYSIESRTILNGQEKQKLADAYVKFTEDMKILISGSADKLSSKMVDRLEDMLVHQQRLKVYEMLQHGFATQSAVFHHDLQLEKIAEIKSSLHRVVFEKAKLQLKHVKRERASKRLDVLSSRLQDSQTLIANIASLPPAMHTSAVGHGSLPVNLAKEHEVCHDKLTTMRQAIDDLDRKILTLTKMFHARCKLKAEPGISETIALVNEHLTKRTSHRLIRLDIQMWVVEGIANVNGQHNVILNYLDFITQSINIVVVPTSSIRSSFKLNDANITKNFPNIDACIAFGFVFNSETACKYVGAKTLAQETQVTTSLLGSLLDVVEEVQIAQIELQNLTQSSFSSPSEERLDLMLCFFNFDSGRKVSITFDLSCLKRGLYPSEILPLQLSPPIDKIRDTVKDVRTGHMRILHLCRSVSRVVQTLTA